MYSSVPKNVNVSVTNNMNESVPKIMTASVPKNMHRRVTKSRILGNLNNNIISAPKNINIKNSYNRNIRV